MSTRWYPLFHKGNPQLRVFLPNFWMKLVKPEYETQPANKVKFIVSSEMTRLDVKNYLEQIYKVPVMDVKTVNLLGKTRSHPYKKLIHKEEDFKVAYVTLPKDMKFEFPDVTVNPEEEKSKEDKAKKDVEMAKKAYKKNSMTDKNRRPGVPSFFGL